MSDSKKKKDGLKELPDLTNKRLDNNNIRLSNNFSVTSNNYKLSDHQINRNSSKQPKQSKLKNEDAQLKEFKEFNREKEVNKELIFKNHDSMYLTKSYSNNNDLMMFGPYSTKNRPVKVLESSKMPLINMNVSKSPRSSMYKELEGKGFNPFTKKNYNTNINSIISNNPLNGIVKNPALTLENFKQSISSLQGIGNETSYSNNSSNMKNIQNRKTDGFASSRLLESNSQSNILKVQAKLGKNSEEEEIKNDERKNDREKKSLKTPNNNQNYHSSFKNNLLMYSSENNTSKNNTKDSLIEDNKKPISSSVSNRTTNSKFNSTSLSLNQSKFENKVGINTKSIYNSKVNNNSSNTFTSINNISNLTTNDKFYDKNDKQKNNIEKKKQPESIDIMSLINSNHAPLNLNVLSHNYSNYESSKHSFKKCNFISAYAANTHQGCVRNYNEDRVSIILNITKPNSYKGTTWPKCSFFAVYDGHGGSGCADYLRDNLHQFIIKDSNFPNSPKEAILKGCATAEEEFTKKHALNSSETDIIDRSGSCAVFALFIDDYCYIGNIGDSRAIISKNEGKEISSLTRDHKPNDELETKRIYSNGGRVYQTQTSAGLFGLNAFSGFNIHNFSSTKFNNNQMLSGPSRVFPGRLSVSRTFGDVEAKIIKFGGLPHVLTAIPDIFSFKIEDNIDFIVLGCDGIYDLFKNEELCNAVYMSMPDKKDMSIHSFCGRAVDMIMKTALSRNSLDNITTVLISFNNLEQTLKTNIEKEKVIDDNLQAIKDNIIQNKTNSNFNNIGNTNNTNNNPNNTKESVVVNNNEKLNNKENELKSITTRDKRESRDFGKEKDGNYEENINAKFVNHQKSIRNNEKTLHSIINENKFKQTPINNAFRSIYGSNSTKNSNSNSIISSSNYLTSNNFNNKKL